MMDIPYNILQVAFDLQNGASLTEEQQAICEEWTTGRAQDFMKIGIDDPRLFEYLALCDKCENEKDAKWESLNS